MSVLVSKKVEKVPQGCPKTFMNMCTHTQAHTCRHMQNKPKQKRVNEAFYWMTVVVNIVAIVTIRELICSIVFIC